MNRSLRLRLLGGAVLWITVALAVAGLAIAALLRGFVERTFDARLNANMIAVMTAVEFDDAGTLRLGRAAGEPEFDRVLSSWYWQIADGDEVLLASRSLWNADFGTEVGAVDADVATASLNGPAGETLRAIRRDFTAPGGSATLRITVAGPAAEIEAAVGSILPPLFGSLALLGAGLVLAVLLQILYGLKPLARLRADLAAVRRGGLARMPEASHREIAPLVAELNGLIDHNRTIIERARTHVGNLAHGLKTPLSILANEAAAYGRDPTGVVAESVGAMERQIQHHLRRARAAASRDLIGTTTPLAPVLDDVALALRRIHADRALAVTVDCPADLVFLGEREDLQEMVGNLIDNACKWATSVVAATARLEDGSLVLSVSDDGPGMTDAEAEAALERGARLDESVPGTGLGLAIVHDLAQLYGGALGFRQRLAGGLAVELRLPGVV